MGILYFQEPQYITTPWIYHNPDLWLISLSSNWTNWITIADKNLWATTVWSSWDTLDESNCGKFYQQWNNFGFPHTWPVTTSNTQVNASTYWPWNYYSSNVFITSNSDGWDNSDNKNLWWGVTGTYEAMQWPCDTGFHVPSANDWQSLLDIWIALWWGANDGTNLWLAFKLPFAWYLLFRSPSLSGAGTNWFYWSATQNSDSIGRGHAINFTSANISMLNNTLNNNWLSIRPFANTPIQPDETWTVLYQPS